MGLHSRGNHSACSVRFWMPHAYAARKTERRGKKLLKHRVRVTDREAFLVGSDALPSEKMRE